MSKELQAQTFQTSGTVYARLRNSADQIWNTAGTPAFEAFNAANIADYDIAATQDGTTGWWYADLPAPTTAAYSYVFYLQAGGSPSQSDLPISSTGIWAPATIDVNVTQVGGSTQSATDLKDFADTGYDPSTHKVQGVVLTDTLTTYTGNTPQTGDSFARIGATGSGLTSLAPSATALSTATWTNGRAALIDNLDATVSSRASASALATLQSDVTAIGVIVSANLDVAVSTRASATVAPSWFSTPTVPTVADIVVGVFDTANTIESLTFRNAVKFIAAEACGESSGSELYAPVIKSAGGSDTRITATIDSDGNRTSITLTP